MSSPSTPASAPKRYSRYADDEDEETMLAPDVAKRASWKTNPFVPLGAFGGAVLLGVGIVVGRRNSGWSMSQTIMQARVLAQGACVAGLVGVGAYATIERRKADLADLEAERIAAVNASKRK